MKKQLLILTLLIVCSSFVSAIAPNNGLIGYWSGNEGKGSVAQDYSGNNNNGIMTNGATFSSGRLGKGFSFDGVNDYVNLGTNQLDYERNDSFSGCSWVYPSDVTAIAHSIVTKSKNSGIYEGWAFTLFDRTNIKSSALSLFLINNSDTNVIEVNTPANSISPNVWQHVCFSYNGSSSASGVKLYINGVSQSLTITSNTLTGSIKIPVSAQIGSREQGQLFKGTMDETRVYNRVISATEIQQLYKSGQQLIKPNTKNQTIKASNNNGLVGYWSFNEGTGLNTGDYSGNNNNGVLTNSPNWTSGKLGNGINFDGTNDYVSIKPNPKISNLNNFTITSWIKPSNLAEGRIWAKNSVAFGPPQFGTGTYNHLSAQLDFSGTDPTTDASNNTLTPNIWNFVTMTFKTGDGGIRFYVNGVETSYQRRIAETGTIMSGTTNNSRIGGDNNNNRFLRSAIDEVRIYDRSLSKSEVNQLYKSGQQLVR